MTNSVAQQPPESRLRRWWRSFYGAVESMEISGYEHLADRIDYLETRLQRLEALQAPSSSDQAPTD